MPKSAEKEKVQEEKVTVKKVETKKSDSNGANSEVKKENSKSTGKRRILILQRNRLRLLMRKKKRKWI